MRQSRYDIQRRYELTAKGRATVARYRATEKYRIAVNRRNHSVLARNVRGRYRRTEAAQIIRHLYNRQADVMLTSRLNKQMRKENACLPR